MTQQFNVSTTYGALFRLSDDHQYLLDSGLQRFFIYKFVNGSYILIQEFPLAVNSYHELDITRDNKLIVLSMSKNIYVFKKK